MLEILILSFLVTFIYTPYGYLITSGSNIRSFSLQLIFAVIILSFLALFINFFSPLNKLINSIVLSLPLFIILKYKNVYLTKKFFIFCFYSSLIIFLLITSSNVYRPDAGLYHLPFINILNQEKIIVGLSNLHFRFGHISILQYTSAIFNNFLFNENGIVFPSSLLAGSVILNFLSNFNRCLKNQKFDFYFFLISAFLIFIFYKINRYSEYGNDAPAHLLMFVLIAEILKNYNNINNNKITDLYILAFFILFNKIILIFSLLFPFILILKKNYKLILFTKKNFFLIMFIIFWFTKNILNTGCFLYPLKSSCLEIYSWTNKHEAQKVSIENEAWAKGWPDYAKQNKNVSQLYYSKDFFWLKTWKNNHFIKIIEILSPYLVLLIILSFISLKNFKSKKLDYRIKYLIFISILGSAMWFLKVPVFRYGYSYLIILISLIFATLCNYFIIKKNVKKIFISTILILLTIFVVKNLDRIIFDNEKYFNYPWPRFFSMDKNNILIEPKFKYLKNKKIYYTSDNYCMYGYSPCGISVEKLDIKNILNYNIFIVNN